MIIRQTLIDELDSLLETQRSKGYKTAWVWYEIKSQSAPFSEAELYYIANLLGYKPGWAKYKIEEQQANQLLYQPLTPLQKSLNLLELDVPFYSQDLKRSYKSKALKLHPDKGGRHEDFIALNKAYQYLKNYLRAEGVI